LHSSGQFREEISTHDIHAGLGNIDEFTQLDNETVFLSRLETHFTVKDRLIRVSAYDKFVRVLRSNVGNGANLEIKVVHALRRSLEPECFSGFITNLTFNQDFTIGEVDFLVIEADLKRDISV
jgi:hypothetical protein